MKTKYLIIGGGFAGLTLAKRLARFFKGSDITLVNRTEFFLFTPEIYEVATAEEELVTQEDLKKSVSFSLSKVLKNLGVNFIEAEVKSIDLQKKTVSMQSKSIEYEHIFLALGSESEYFGIAGAKENALPLKTFQDALRIKNAVEFSVQRGRSDVKKKLVRIVVAGGGYTGVEVAGELVKLVNHVAWKNGFPREKIEIQVIEGASELIPGLDSRLSRDASERLRDLGVRISLMSLISKVDPGIFELKNGERETYDVLIWAAGVKSTQVPIVQKTEIDPKGRIKVNEYFQIKDYSNAYVLGDNSCFTSQDGIVSPPTAQSAIRHAEYLGRIFPLLLKNQKPPAYNCPPHGYVIMIGGQWAIMKHGNWYVTGRLAYFAKQCAHFWFFKDFLGWWRAAMLTIFEYEIFSRND